MLLRIGKGTLEGKVRHVGQACVCSCTCVYVCAYVWIRRDIPVSRAIIAPCIGVGIVGVLVIHHVVDVVAVVVVFMIAVVISIFLSYCNSLFRPLPRSIGIGFS